MALEVARVEFVEILAARIEFCRGLADLRAMPVEDGEHALFVACRGGLDPPQRIARDQERRFDRAVMPPEADNAARRVIGTAGIGKGDGHGALNCLSTDDRSLRTPLVSGFASAG